MIVSWSMIRISPVETICRHSVVEAHLVRVSIVITVLSLERPYKTSKRAWNIGSMVPIVVLVPVISSITTISVSVVSVPVRTVRRVRSTRNFNSDLLFLRRRSLFRRKPRCRLCL